MLGSASSPKFWNVETEFKSHGLSYFVIEILKWCHSHSISRWWWADTVFFSFEYSRAVKFYKSQQMTASTLPIVNYFEAMLQNLKVLLFFLPQQPLNTFKFLCISRYILENILSYSCQLKRVSRKLILSFRNGFDNCYLQLSYMP